ncbi:ATP-binding protein [Kribbella voronezhensis]|uniref:ATP-binding protein n=1 Tax=Kribbella voronezhensis TaxID=2512212 RepID=UPI0026938FEA
MTRHLGRASDSGLWSHAVTIPGRWPGAESASNESFGGWTKTFTDPRLCAAIVDRLTFGGTILETGTDSYRLAQATRQRTT